METAHKKLPPNPRESANIFSTLSFWWTIDIFKNGVRKSLETCDLFSANKSDSSSILGDNLGRSWAKQTKTGKSSLLKAIGSTFRTELIQLGLLHLSVQMIKSIGIPFFLGQFLLYFREGSTVPYKTAVRNAIGLLFSVAYAVVMGNRFQATAQHFGMRLRIAVCSLIYRKTLRLSRTALSDTNPGKVINLISNDVTRLEYVPLSMNSLWISPLNSIIIVYFLWSEAGVSTISGIVFLVLIAPTQSYFGKLTAKFRYKISIKTDERVRLMEEIISGCQVIKMYAWEKPFAKLIQFVRKMELKSVRKLSLLRGNFMGLIFLTYRFAIFSTIVTLVFMEEAITASKVFAIFAFYNALSMQITRYFYHGFSDASETWVVIKRLQKYLEYGEISGSEQINGMETENGVDHKSKSVNGSKVLSINSHQQLPNDTIVSIRNGTAQWNIMNENKSEVGEFSLKNLNIDFKKGKLIGIVGPVGSGKTSLLQTFLRELPLVSGSLIVGGNLSYAAQEPWVFAGSVRQNILFGQKMDQVRYDRTVKACALLADFKQFPQGDNSLVGDKGAALSGGQKARINLARAIYREADIYLLDDPLSAVDAHVGRYLFNSVIGPQSYLAKTNATRILVTHQVHFLSKADWIISLKNGAIEFQGTIRDLSKSGLSIAQLMNASETESNPLHGSQQALNTDNVVDELTEDSPLQQNIEQSSKGKIDGSLLGNFIKCGATPFDVFLFVGLFVCSQLCASTIDWWLSYFVSREELRTSLALNITHLSDNEPNLWSSKEYLMLHTGLIVIFIVLLVIRAVVISNILVNLSQGLHDRMFTGIISSPLRFFDLNPSGRILNRFSKDLGNVDELLPKTLFDACQCSLHIPGVLIVIASTFPLLVIPMVIMLTAFVFLTRITLKTSNDIKRIEGITRSPVFSHMASSITGLSTIRAFSAETILTHEFDAHQDIHSGAFYLYIYTSTAFGFILELMSFLSITAIIITILLVDKANLQGNKVGLIITQSLIIQEVLYICAKQFASVCNIMMGVERLLEYKNLPAEKQPDVSQQISNNWPPNGKLEFRNLSYRYFSEGDAVLNNLSFIVQPGEKIGIVGRTGAGKSSLIGAIFRLAVLDGKIFIDDIDTGTIFLMDLRTKISIIPQDPVLFSGTLRRNLDPFEEFDDAQLWKVLEEVELKDIISASGLESVILTGGSNFSVGQRQLLCLARALLRNNRILVLDEATANVDPDTDMLIQRTIREKFVKCTVLTVAHRLHTIIDSDRVLVMSLGKIEEFAPPHELLNKKDGIFKEMIEATGLTESNRLKTSVYQQHHSSEGVEITRL